MSIEKGAGHNLMSAEDFWNLPIEERVRLMVQNKVQFLKDGQVVPPRDAVG